MPSFRVTAHGKLSESIFVRVPIWPSSLGSFIVTAGGFVVGLAFAVPVELHLDAAVFVAVNFFAGGAGDDGGLAAEDFWFRVFEGRAVVPSHALRV